MTCNRFELQGQLAQLEPLRFTPAGIPIVNFSIVHGSTQMEAGAARMVRCEVPAMAVGQLAEQVSRQAPGRECVVSGFVAARSLKNAQLVLHVNEIRY